MRIIKTKSSEKLNEYDLKDVKRLNAEWFIYHYENYGYEGDGFAIWKIGKKYYYTELGHCSCNGPVEDLNSIGYNLTEIKKIVKKYTKGSQEVIDRVIKENK